MFRHFLEFELRFWLRGWMVWIFLLVIGAMIFGATSSDMVQVGGALGNTRRNAPFVIQNFYAITSVLTLLMTTAFMNSAAICDFQYNTSQIIFSLPVKKSGYLLGRFLGASVPAMIPALGVTAGVLLARYMPWVDAQRFGGVYWDAHSKGVLLFAVPNTLFVAAILFAVAARFRSTTISFIAALLLLVGFGVTEALTSDLKNEALAAIVDPFGGRAFDLATKYWTVAERNTRSMGLEGLLLWNRLIWLSVGGLVFTVTAGWVRLGDMSSRKRKPVQEEQASVASGISIPLTTPNWSGHAALRQWWGTVRIEFGALVKTPTFLVILAAALLNCVVSLLTSSAEGYANGAEQEAPVNDWIEVGAFAKPAKGKSMARLCTATGCWCRAAI